MRRAAGIAALALSAMLLGSCAGGSGLSDRDRRYARNLRPVAQPGEVVAAEIAFARTAQEKGQWTAFAEFATKDAVMFVPQPVNAQQWLKGQANPAQAVKWQPHQVWSSCDGSLAVTKGAWQRPDGSQGYFTTVWERQRDGDYKWVLDQGDALAEPLKEPNMVQAEVADCGSENALAALQDQPVGTMPSHGGRGSRDGSLAYDWEVAANGARRITVSIIKEGTKVDVLDLSVAAP